VSTTYLPAGQMGKKRRFAPIIQPAPIPESDIFDYPRRVFVVNQEWISVVLGALTALHQDKIWRGTDSERAAAIQQILKLKYELQEIENNPTTVVEQNGILGIAYIQDTGEEEDMTMFVMNGNLYSVCCGEAKLLGGLVAVNATTGTPESEESGGITLQPDPTYDASNGSFTGITKCDLVSALPAYLLGRLEDDLNATQLSILQTNTLIELANEFLDFAHIAAPMEAVLGLSGNFLQLNVTSALLIVKDTDFLYSCQQALWDVLPENPTQITRTILRNWVNRIKYTGSNSEWGLLKIGMSLWVNVLNMRVVARNAFISSGNSDHQLCGVIAEDAGQTYTPPGSGGNGSGSGTPTYTIGSYRIYEYAGSGFIPGGQDYTFALPDVAGTLVGVFAQFGILQSNDPVARAYTRLVWSGANDWQGRLFSSVDTAWDAKNAWRALQLQPAWSLYQAQTTAVQDDLWLGDLASGIPNSGITIVSTASQGSHEIKKVVQVRYVTN